MSTATDELIEIFHIDCEKPAFYWKGEPESCEAFTAAKCILLDGKQAEVGQPIFCGSCGEQLADDEIIFG